MLPQKLHVSRSQFSKESHLLLVQFGQADLGVPSFWRGSVLYTNPGWQILWAAIQSSVDGTSHHVSCALEVTISDPPIGTVVWPV